MAGSHCASLLVVGLLYAVAHADETRAGRLTVRTTADGCGFLDEVRFSDREVLKAPAEFVGAHVSLVRTGEGTAQSLFRHVADAILPAKLTAIEAEGTRLKQRGAYTDGRLSIPFTRTIALSPDAGTLQLEETTDFGQLPEGYMLAEHRLSLPLNVCPDEHARMIGLGGTKRNELFRMDMNDVPHRAQNISAPRGHQPYWDLGAVLQRRAGYQLWKANHADTPVYPLESGTGAPGWADYSEPDWGLTVQVGDPQESAPWQLLIDARKGLFALQAHPSSEMPVSSATLGRRQRRWTLSFHDRSWPTTNPCELSVDRYEGLLNWLNTPDSRWTRLNVIATWGIGLPVRDGTRPPDEMKDLCRRIIFFERLQPSVLLRLLYRGDAYRMQGIVREILGKPVPRNQPLERWEDAAKEVLSRIERDGIPARAAQ